MILSVVSLFPVAIVSAFTVPVDDMGFIMLLLSFPIRFILGERIELVRVVSKSNNKRFRSAFMLVAFSVILFATCSTLQFSTLAILSFMAGSLLLSPSRNTLEIDSNNDEHMQLADLARSCKAEATFSDFFKNR